MPEDRFNSMNGSELSFKYYESFGLPEFSSKFPELFPLLCFGLAGAGSECYGFDDELSQDHDFEPGFCVFYPEDKLDSRQVFALERAYAKLPKDFMGFSRSIIAPYGGERRRGVIGVNDFFSRYVPGGTVPSDPAGWAALRDELLCEALNGVVFSDNYGLFSEIRSGLRNVPDDIRKKRLSGLFFSLSQSGWYNVPRMLKRGDFGAVRLFLTDFVIDAAKCLYVLNDQFCPYKKWLLLCIPVLVALYFMGAFDAIIARFNEQSLTTGRAENLAEYFASGINPLRFFSGYGDGSILSSSSPVNQVNDAFEFPVMMYSYYYGILFSLLHIGGAFAYVTWRLLRKRRSFLYVQMIDKSAVRMLK